MKVKTVFSPNIPYNTIVYRICIPDLYHTNVKRALWKVFHKNINKYNNPVIPKQIQLWMKTK